MTHFMTLKLSLFWLHVLQDATQKSQKVFVHVPSEIGAYEAEEIGKFFVIMDLREVHSGIWILSSPLYARNAWYCNKTL